jgi:dTDP-4-amino-4,6-dideoxygalactose transaminase
MRRSHAEAPLPDRPALLGGSPLRHAPWPAWPEHGEAERAALERVLASRSWGGFPSPNTEARAFSERFAAYCGVRHAIPCANGTVAIGLALQAARIEPGAEVVTTAYTFVGTATGILQAGARPVFADVLADSYCIDPDAVAAAIGPRTQAVVAVHLACSMADLDRLRALCDAHGLLLVEDCAHAHGARWRDRAAGAVGDLGTFSMQSSKLLTAGEGGAITTDDGAFAARAWSLVNCGRKEPGCDAFPERLLGTNARISEWQAAILTAQLECLDAQHARRTANADAFERAIAALPGLRPLARDPRVTRRTHYQLIVRYEPGAWEGLTRDLVLRALVAEGVPAAGRFYVPLPEDPLFPMDAHTNPLARDGVVARGAHPVAARAAYDEAIWLPHACFLGAAREVEDLVSAFAKVHANAKALAEAVRGGMLA